MRLTYRADSFFPFGVPEVGAGDVGAQTIYPAGFSLGVALQLYWRAKHYRLVATGDGTAGSLTQALSVNALVPSRNLAVGTSSYGLLDGFAPTGPGDLVPGRGLRQTVAGSGTVTASGPDGSGTNTAASFDLVVRLFDAEGFAVDPVVKFDDLWWPALGISCAVSNTVDLDTGGELEMAFAATTLPDEASTALMGACVCFGVSVPVYGAPLAPPSGPDPGETRTFSGVLTVEDEF